MRLPRSLRLVPFMYLTLPPDTDDNYTPDTKVVSDGYFHESEYRSAPYFDLVDADNAAGIDGIKLLDTNFG